MIHFPASPQIGVPANYPHKKNINYNYSENPPAGFKDSFSPICYTSITPAVTKPPFAWEFRASMSVSHRSQSPWPRGQRLVLKGRVEPESSRCRNTSQLSPGFPPLLHSRLSWLRPPLETEKGDKDGGEERWGHSQKKERNKDYKCTSQINILLKGQCWAKSLKRMDGCECVTDYEAELQETHNSLSQNYLEENWQFYPTVSVVNIHQSLQINLLVKLWPTMVTSVVPHSFRLHSLSVSPHRPENGSFASCMNVSGLF